MSMSYEEALDAHLREFDREVATLRDFMAQIDYDNVESPEVRHQQMVIRAVVGETFALKVCHSRAKSYAKPKP